RPAALAHAAVVMRVPPCRSGGVAFTRYFWMGKPPLSAGGFQDRFQVAPPPLAAVKFCGGPGGPSGVAVAGSEGLLLPATFVATTVQLYAVPFVRPVTRPLFAEPAA